MAAAQEGLPVVVVNPTACFGPYDAKPSCGTQILMIAKRQMPGFVQGRPNVIDMRNVVDAMVLAGEKGRIGERYIVGNWNTTRRNSTRSLLAWPASLHHDSPCRLFWRGMGHSWANGFFAPSSTVQRPFQHSSRKCSRRFSTQ